MSRGIGDRDMNGAIGEMALDAFKSALVKGTDEDKAVYVSAADTVALVTAGKDIDGVVREIDYVDSCAAVQLTGFATLTYTGTDPSVGRGALVGGAVNGQVAIDSHPFGKEVAVTVAQNGTSGSSAADVDLVGGTVTGIEPSGAEDQLISNVAVNSDGSVTVTLHAAATNQNTFTVEVQKAVAKRGKVFLITNVDTSNKLVTFKL